MSNNNTKWNTIDTMSFTNFKELVNSSTLNELIEAPIYLILSQDKKLEYYAAKKSELLRLNKAENKESRTNYKNGTYSEQSLKGYILFLVFSVFKFNRANELNESLKYSVVQHIYNRIYGYTNTEIQRVHHIFSILNNSKTAKEMKISHARKSIINFLQLNAATQLLSANKKELKKISEVDLENQEIKDKVEAEVKLLNSIKPIITTVDRQFDDRQKLMQVWFFQNLDKYYTTDNPIVSFWLDKIHNQLGLKAFKIAPKDLFRFELQR